MGDVNRKIEAMWKVESTRLIAAIARVTRDIGVAEELAQDALVAALERWPGEGIPENPAAWLMTAAKRRAIDSLRRGQMVVQKHEEVARELEVQQQRLGEAMDQALDQVIDDDVLRLIFTACHPVLAVQGRDSAGNDLARTRAKARRRRKVLCFAGSDCSLPHASSHSRTDGLGTDRSSLRQSDANRAISHRGTESSGCFGYGAGPGCWTCSSRCPSHARC